MEYKEDIRIQKTRRDLRGAIIKLVKEKPIEKISVTEICETAMVNRMTFYKYYEDKYVLLDDTFNDIKDQMLAKMPEGTSVKSIEDARKCCANLIELVIQLINQNIDLILALKKNGNNELFSIITKICESSITDLFTEVNKIKALKYPIPFISSFIFGGFLSTLNYWIEYQSQTDITMVDQIISDMRDNVLEQDFLFKD